MLAGEVPLRDFMAYDPGRYYWSAAAMALAGDNGIVALRASLLPLQVAGLFAGLVLIARDRRPEARASNVLYLVLSAAILAVWMVPRHKLVDISISLGLVAALTQLVARPEPRRYFVAGTCVGIAAVFGRNHGVYGVAASAGLMAWLQLGNQDRTVARGVCGWGCGVVAGFSPVLAMAALVPDFGAALWRSILFHFEVGATNLPLPIPWPWEAIGTGLPLPQAIAATLEGLCFIALPAFAIATIGGAVRARLRGLPVAAPVVAAAFVALPYSHFAFSRADTAHLAQGIFPMLVGMLAALGGARALAKWPGIAVLALASLGVTLQMHPGWQCRGSRCVDADVGRDRLSVDRGVADHVALLHTLARRHAAPDQTLVVAPFWPGAYAVLGRKSPLWEIYALFPRPPAFEQAEIRRMTTARPAFVLLQDPPPRGLEACAFPKTHPLTSAYLAREFELAPEPAGRDLRLYLPRTPGPT